MWVCLFNCFYLFFQKLDEFFGIQSTSQTCDSPNVFSHIEWRQITWSCDVSISVWKNKGSHCPFSSVIIIHWNHVAIIAFYQCFCFFTFPEQVRNCFCIQSASTCVFINWLHSINVGTVNPSLLLSWPWGIRQ